MSEGPKPVAVLNNEEVMALIRSLGLDPKQIGDMTVNASFPIAGVATFNIEVRMFATEEQIQALKEAVGASASVNVKAAVMDLETYAEREVQFEIKPRVE